MQRKPGTPDVPATTGPGAQPEPHRKNADHLSGLLDRMHHGDRLAAAAFMLENSELIRRRFRGRISRSLRPLFDSHDLVATVSRRLDELVLREKFGAGSAGELWALVSALARHSLSEHTRRSLRHREPLDVDRSRGERPRGTGQAPTAPAPVPMATDGALLDECLSRLENPMDGTVLMLRLNGLSHSQIARQVGGSPASVRKRWQRIRESLRDLEDQR